MMKTTKTYVLATVLSLAGILSVQRAAATVRYVKPVSSGTGSGSSWSNASSDIQAMINASSEGDAVWVAAGTYKPNRSAVTPTIITPNDRSNAFLMKDGVSVYGGFVNANETSLSQRDTVTQSISTLSGDLGIAINNSDNAYHVVLNIANDTTAVLNGFTITAGNANNIFLAINVELTTLVACYQGAGIYSVGGGTFANCFLSGNSSVCTMSGGGGGMGGGMYCEGTTVLYGVQQVPITPRLTSCVFDGNQSDQGGGLYVQNMGSSFYATHCVFNNNTSLWYGGGVYMAWGDFVFDQCNFNGNQAMKNGGAVMAQGVDSVAITNSYIGNNTAMNGAGIYSWMNLKVRLLQDSIMNNIASDTGGAIYVYGPNSHAGDISVSRCVINNNAAASTGGGIFFEYPAGNAQILYSYIANNTVSSGNGGGIACVNGGNPYIFNSALTGNKANGGNGGGIYATDSSAVRILNSTMAGSVAAAGGDLYIAPGSTGAFSVTNSILRGGISKLGGILGVNYSLLPGSFSGSVGNINSAAYTDAQVFANAAGGDYTLAAGSPAIDRGNSDSVTAHSGYLTDMAGSARIVGSAVDMGAWERQVPLPLSLLDFTAIPAAQGVQINWSAVPGTIAAFELQKSEDGVHFKPIYSVKDNETGKYDFNDNAPVSFNYYRLLLTSVSGQENYSGVRVVKMSTTANNELAVFPNPVDGNGTISLLYNGNTTQMYSRISDVYGRVVHTSSLFNIGGAAGNNHSLSLNAIAKGTYMITLVSADGKIIGRQKVVVQ